MEELSSMSSHISVEKAELTRTPSFSVNRPGEETGITIAGIPLGHQFTSLVLALLQVSGRAPKVDQSVIDQIKSVKGEHHFETYVSLSCHNCPDVVQALNIMSVLNPNITHTMIDGAAFKEEVERKNVMAVPAVYLNAEFFNGGRTTLEEILSKIVEGPGANELSGKDPYVVLVIGGRPARVPRSMLPVKESVQESSRNASVVRCLIR